jgi:hypothetical protein
MKLNINPTTFNSWAKKRGYVPYPMSTSYGEMEYCYRTPESPENECISASAVLDMEMAKDLS